MHLPALVQRDFHSIKDVVENLVGHHVRATSRTVDREEPQRREILTKQMEV